MDYHDQSTKLNQLIKTSYLCYYYYYYCYYYYLLLFNCATFLLHSYFIPTCQQQYFFKKSHGKHILIFTIDIFSIWLLKQNFFTNFSKISLSLWPLSTLKTTKSDDKQKVFLYFVIFVNIFNCNTSTQFQALMRGSSKTRNI